MKTIHVEASHIIPANIETVYSIIADYHVGHQAILPRPAFQEMQVIEGGYGTGTHIKLHVKVFGQSYYYNQVVSEPEPGRVIRETDVNTGQYSEFTLEPVSDNQTRVTIVGKMPASSGIKGFLERITQPVIVGGMFKTELKNLEAYVNQAIPAINKA